MTRMSVAWLGCATFLVGLTGASAAAAEKSPLGRVVKDFTLKDYRGKEHSLSDLSAEKIVVVAFLGTECPLAKLYAPRLARLDEKYAAHGVAFLGINSNRQDSITEIAAHARVHGVRFPVLKDLGNHVADQMGAIRTPEVFVLDDQRVVRYWGRIDDQYGVGYVRDKPTHQDLASAIDQLLDGKLPDTAATPSVGCFIGRVRQPESHSEVTYSNQIARLFQKRCVECHRSGEIAPFALAQYEEVAGWAETIAEVVRDGRMPPWHADPHHGKFANNRRLSDAEKDLIYRWVSAGAPEGDTGKLPEPRQFVEGWQLPQEPDLIIPMRDRPYDVPAEGAVKYQYFKVDPGFTQDKWLKLAEVQPGNRAVVHHILVFLQRPGANRPSGRRGFLVGYVPGMRVRPLPDGMAKHIPAGSQLVFQVHYTPIGSVQQDLSKLGLVFADSADITHMVKTTSAIDGRFRIPPHAENHRVEATTNKFDRDVTLLGMTPHMHLRGKSFLYEALYPDGKRETLLDVPAYDFNWQTAYRLQDPLLLPSGSRLHCVAHFDNSENNLANPDPSMTVRWGDQTWDEMMIGYFDIAVRIDPTELANGKLPDFGPDVKEQARALLRRLDRDENGEVTRAEVPKRMKRIFSRLDGNGDEILSLDELVEGFKRWRQES